MIDKEWENKKQILERDTRNHFDCRCSKCKKLMEMEFVEYDFSAHGLRKGVPASPLPLWTTAELAISRLLPLAHENRPRVKPYNTVVKPNAWNFSQAGEF